MVIKESLGAVFLTSAADQQTGEQTLKNKAQQFLTPQLGEQHVLIRGKLFEITTTKLCNL